MQPSPSSTTLPFDRLTWLWLAIGALLLPWTQFQTIVPLAAWIAPILLLRFLRTQRTRIALPGLALIHYLAAVVALRGVFPMPDPFLFGLGGLLGVIPYAVDRFWARRLPLFLGTLLFPATSTALDYLFGLSSLGTLGSPAYSQFGNLALTQVVALTGIWGVVFLMAWLAPVVNTLWEGGIDRSRVQASLVPFGAVLLAMLIYGSLRVAFFAPTAPTVRIAALAADRALWHGMKIPPIAEVAVSHAAVRDQARAQFAPILEDLFARTTQQARAGAKIVSWSEAAAFALQEDEPALLQRAQTLAQQEGIYLQLAVLFARRTDHFPFVENRAILIDPAGQIVWDYFKATTPLGDALAAAPGPGVIPTVETPYGKLATVICFDADFPALIRQAGQAGVDILLVPSNDWQPIHTIHARAATLRAIENGFALVRATGNGLAIAVNDLGIVLASGDYYTTNNLTMVVDVPIQGRSTLYTRLGDSFAWLCMGGVVVLALLALRHKNRPVAPPTIEEV